MYPPPTPNYERLRACAVRIVDSSHGSGTGAFVAPGKVLTCKHVVFGDTRAPRECDVHFRGAVHPARCVGASDDDLAILEVDFHDHPCILVRELVGPRDQVYFWGFPGQETGVRGESVTALCEGRIVDEIDGIRRELIKFTPGGVRPGMSGAPLMNESTGAICGVVKRTRDSTLDMGGFAVPSALIWASFREIRAANEAYHAAHPDWRDANRGSDLRAALEDKRFDRVVEIATERIETNRGDGELRLMRVLGEFAGRCAGRLPPDAIARIEADLEAAAKDPEAAPTAWRMQLVVKYDQFIRARRHEGHPTVEVIVAELKKCDRAADAWLLGLVPRTKQAAAFIDKVERTLAESSPR